MKYFLAQENLRQSPEEPNTVQYYKQSKNTPYKKTPTLLLIFASFCLINLSLYVIIAPFGPSSNRKVEIKELLSPQTTPQTMKIILKRPTPKLPALKPEQLKPFYIWLGDLPDHHLQMLKKLDHPFRLIRNCDLLMKKMEDQLMEKFDPWIYNTVNLKSDICRFIMLYYEGGLYMDMDAQVDLVCMGKYLKDKRIFFEATPVGSIDIFTIYSSKPFDPEIYKAIESFTTFKSYIPYNTFLTTKINKNAMIVAKSGCVQHKQERSWIPLLEPGNQGK